MEIELTNGPGKLCQAFSIDTSLYGVDMTDNSSLLRICENTLDEEFKAGISKRIGISKAAGWRLRFFIKNNKFVSRYG